MKYSKTDITAIVIIFVIFILIVTYIFFKESVLTLIISGCVFQMLVGIFSIFEVNKINKYKLLNIYIFASLFVLILVILRF